MAKDIRATVTLRVRYAECDPLGIVYHSNYAVWFEVARTELLRRERNISYVDMQRDGIFLVVTKLQLDYKKPARYDDEVAITAILVRSSGAKIIINYEVLRGRDLLCTGTTTLACVNSEGEVVPVPENLVM